MKCGARIAVGVGAGYLLGRTKKMRWALILAAAGATGKLGGAPRELLQRGTKLLGSSEGLGKITDTVRGELVDALKSAAVTAASSRIDSMTDRLQERAGGRGKAPRDDKDEEAEEPRGKAADEEAEEEEDYEEAEDEYDEEEPSEEEEEERPAAKRQRAHAGEAGSRRGSREDDEDRGESRRRAEKVGAGTGRSPVRRTRR